MKQFLALLLLAAHAAPAAAFFPFCMYGVSETKDLKPLADAGFNCFHTYAQDPAKLAELAAAASPLGLRMVAPPDKLAESRRAADVKAWPVLAWYLADEPEVSKLKPAALAALEKKAKDWDPSRPTAFVMGNGLAAFNYGAAGDALMVDWYPVSHLKLETVGYQVALAKQAAAAADPSRPGKPVWAVLQAFDWKDYPQLLAERVGRFPTYDELRFMTYLSVARGASGLFYFTLGSKDGPLYARPDRWRLFERLAAEVNRLMPALEGAEEAPAPAGFDPRLSAKVLKGGGRTFMLLLNTSAEMVPLDVPKLEDWRPLFEEKRDLAALLPGQKARWMPPYRTLVLERRRKFLFF